MASTAVDAARSAGGGAEPDAPKQARRGVLEEARSPVAPSKRAKRSGSSGKAPMEEASPSPSRQGLRDAPAAPASYSTLLNDTAGADIMFEVDGERIPAHRSVLAAQSLYFMEMFDAGPTGGSETGGGALRLQVQAPAGAVRVLLRFLYSGAMPESDDCGESLQPGEMVRMADRAQAHELFQHCLRVFCGGLRKENVIERLVDAEECGPPALRSAIIEWIRKNISHLKVMHVLARARGKMCVCVCVCVCMSSKSARKFSPPACCLQRACERANIAIVHAACPCTLHT